MLKYVYLVKEEVRRSFIITKRYWMNAVSEILTIYLFFLIIMFVGSAMGGQAVSETTRAGALVGMMMWQLSFGALGLLGWGFFNEAAVGTLEHLYLSPLGVVRVFLARSVGSFLTGVVAMLLAGFLAIITTGIRLELPPLEIAVILPLAIAGTYGFGFMVASLTLTFKRTQQVMQLMQFFFLFFTGSMIPLESMHWSIRYFGQTLPLTAGIRALRAVTVSGARLPDITGDLAIMAVTSVVWLAVGIGIYTLADRRARLKGSIGQY